MNSKAEDEIDDVVWPDVARKCFVGGGPHDMNACVDWVLGSGFTGMQAYIDGYRNAAEALFEHAAGCQRMSPELLLFPLAFLWRHHIELALKGIIILGKEIAGEEGSFDPGHRLTLLWRQAKPYIVHQGDPDAPELAHIEENIADFSAIDPHADGFRYPMNRKGDAPSLAGAPQTVSVRKLHEATLAISNFLDAVHMSQVQALDAISDLAIARS